MITKSPLVEKDPYLKPYSQRLLKRYQKARLRELEFTEGKCELKEVANGYLYYGLHKTDTCWVLREKAPNAVQVFVYGDFTYWEVKSNFELHKNENGDWEIEIPLNYLKHGDLYKLWIVWQGGADERLPAYVQRVVQDENTKIFSAQVWDPPKPYQWHYSSPNRPNHPIIYEAHIGMSAQEEKISTYWEFKENVLPRIKKLGYNTIQLMAIHEHPYYGSFGYQVSNFFAPSFRFGTPEELMELIDEAHHLGISVIMDVVHSHSVSNEKEGISKIDGVGNLYFHSGERAIHPVWNSHCFDYGKRDTIFFLLSNLKYWLEVFHFDGFRFDGVTSMCYVNHGIGVDFVDYAQYFDDNVDEDAISYLYLANRLVKQVNSQAFTIAEDVSGLPGLAFSSQLEGVGFDYRMSMGVADFWTKTLKECADECWSPGDIFFRLTDKRPEEQVIAYAESHDQAMVGDQTFLSRMVGAEIYTAMRKDLATIGVQRAVALHKIIRLLTLSLAQGGYMNFMGNEFGHPEWIDFPRKGNDWSYRYARRQWNLATDENLVYSYLYLFDKDMINLVLEESILDYLPQVLEQNFQMQVLAYSRGNYLFVANFSPQNSYTDYYVNCEKGKYTIVLNTDSEKFGGFSRIHTQCTYSNNGGGLSLYLPTRTMIVLRRSDEF
mgnify:FL=1